MNIFKLISAYEFFIPQKKIDKLIRVELLQSTEDKYFFRVRIWQQNMYNLYLSALNTGASGEDLKRLHSSEQVDTDITFLFIENLDWVTGVACESEKILLQQVLSRVETFYNQIDRDRCNE